MRKILPENNDIIGLQDESTRPVTQQDLVNIQNQIEQVATDLSNAVNTSSSVNPNAVAYLSEVVVTTSRLFKSEKIDSLLTLVIPVIIPRSSHGFVLKVELKRLLVKATSSSQ